MPQGVLGEVFRGTLAGDLHASFSELNKHASARSGSKIAYNADVSKPAGLEAARAYIEMLLETDSPTMDWRVKVNGIGLSREFKPAVSLRVGDRYYHKFAFDVTAVLNSPASLGRGGVYVSARFESGGEAVLRVFGYIASYKSEDAASWLSYSTGLLALAPGEEARLTAPNEGGLALEIPLFSPSGAAVEVSVGGAKTEHVFSGLYVFSAPLSGGGEVAIRFSRSLSRWPQPVFLLGALFHRTELKMPLLKAELSSVARAGRELNIGLRLRNLGESKPDSVVLIVLDKGVVRAMKKVEGPGPGQEVSESISLPGDGLSERVIVRTVWRKVSRVMAEDLPVKVPA